MALLDWITSLLLPIFGDITATEGALSTFNQIFWLVLGCVIVHFVIYVPYRAFLHLIQYRKWGK